MRISSAAFGLALTVSVCFGAAAPADDKPVLMSTTNSTTWDSPEALERDAKQGKPAALENLGQMLLSGDGMTKDVPRALTLLEQAVQAGRPNAAFRLGKVYEDGESVAKDPIKAMDYYKKAALAGVSEAQYNLGAMYASARGVKRDFTEGLAWLIVATKHGAEGDGEKQVRARLQSTHRDALIPAAEARAVELEKQLQAPNGRVANDAPAPATGTEAARK